MKTTQLAVLVAAAWFLFSASSARAVEEALPNPGITERVAHGESLISPFRVLVDQEGELTVEAGSIFSDGNENTKIPELLTEPKPVALPRLVLNEGWEGEVILAVAVETDGSVSETMVMESSGNETLDRWAQDLVQGWQFRPAMKDGVPVYECFQIPVIFRGEAVR